MERRFLLVDASILPDVFIKVLKAKELLASGAVRNISSAARQAGLSRSAFYKYKDCVFDARNSRKVITVLATLMDETGSLQALLAGISAAGGQPSMFSQIFESMVNNVKETEAAKNEAYYALATGQLDNPAEATIAATQASLASDLLIQMRNRALDAYSELMRISL